jgi:hypothetical protein
LCVSNALAAETITNRMIEGDKVDWKEHGLVQGRKNRSAMCKFGLRTPIKYYYTFSKRKR